MTIAAAVIAWLGGSAVLLSDGRRGLALGLALLGAGLGGLALDAGSAIEAATLAGGGLVAAALRLRAGPEGWRIMPAGSTPRLILAIVAALISLYLTAVIAGGEDGALRFALLAVIAVLVLRVLIGADRACANTAASGIALALGAGALLGSGGATEAACAAAAVVAIGVQALPHPETDGA